MLLSKSGKFIEICAETDGKIQMKCKLCLRDKELVRSHIIPEFFYKNTYSNSHKISVVSTRRIRKELLNLQKGLRERLLCKDCEQLFSPWEKYVNEMLFIRPQKGRSNHYLIQIKGLDYKTFKMFGLSLIWRASVSSSLFFREIDLGSHEETIRNKLMQVEPGGENEYPMVLSAITMEDVPIVDLITNPETFSEDGFTYMRFFLGSFFWLFVISEDAAGFRLSEFYLKQNGSLLIPKKRAEETEFFQKFSKEVVYQGEIKDYHKNG